MPRRSQTSRRLLDLALRQGAGLVEQAADQGRLAVIDMADDDDLQGGKADHGIHLHIAL